VPGVIRAEARSLYIILFQIRGFLAMGKDGCDSGGGSMACCEQDLRPLIREAVSEKVLFSLKP